MLVPVLQGVEVAGADRNRAYSSGQHPPRGRGVQISRRQSRKTALSPKRTRVQNFEKNLEWEISHGNGPILDVLGKYEDLHVQRVACQNYGVFSINNYPVNKTQDFAKYLFNPVTDTGNTSGTTTGTGTVPGVHVLFLVGGNLHRPNPSNYIVKI